MSTIIDRLDSRAVTKHWARWVTLHGAARVGFRAMARSGDRTDGS